MTHSLKANFKSTSHGKTHRGTLTDGVRLQTERNSSDMANVRSPGGPGPGRDEPVQSHPVRRSGCGLGQRDLPEVSDARRPGRTRGPSEPLASGTAQRRKCGQRAFGPRGAAIPGPCSSPLPWGCPLCCRLGASAPRTRPRRAGPLVGHTAHLHLHVPVHVGGQRGPIKDEVVHHHVQCQPRSPVGNGLVQGTRRLALRFALLLNHRSDAFGRGQAERAAWRQAGRRLHLGTAPGCQARTRTPLVPSPQKRRALLIGPLSWVLRLSGPIPQGSRGVQVHRTVAGVQASCS